MSHLKLINCYKKIKITKQNINRCKFNVLNPLMLLEPLFLIFCGEVYNFIVNPNISKKNQLHKIKILPISKKILSRY